VTLRRRDALESCPSECIVLGWIALRKLQNSAISCSYDSAEKELKACRGNVVDSRTTLRNIPSVKLVYVNTMPMVRQLFEISEDSRACQDLSVGYTVRVDRRSSTGEVCDGPPSDPAIPPHAREGRHGAPLQSTLFFVLSGGGRRQRGYIFRATPNASITFIADRNAKYLPKKSRTIPDQPSLV
jgi:hypothetical protein